MGWGLDTVFSKLSQTLTDFFEEEAEAQRCGRGRVARPLIRPGMAEAARGWEWGQWGIQGQRALLGAWEASD